MTTPVVINWNDVLLVAKDEAEDLKKLELFSYDILARIDVADAPSLTVYEITIDGIVYGYERQIGETTEQATQAIIDQLNNARALFYKIQAVKGDFEDQVLIQAKESYATTTVSVGDYLTAETGNPLMIGGRTFIFEETALRVQESKFGQYLKHAQAFYSAHIAVQAKLPSTGLGSLSSESFPGTTISYLIPTLNPKADEEILMTSYGRRYNSLKKRRYIPYRVIG